MTSQNKSQLQSTFKSQDTEEWLDIHFTRPLGLLWAKAFDHFNIHPNVVTILSIILGAAAGIMFYYPDMTHTIIGILLLIWANLYDSADGQLARMTGKKTRWGRILDGFAGDVAYGCYMRKLRIIVGKLVYLFNHLQDAFLCILCMKR